MFLIIQIALGIVVAFFILVYWQKILKFTKILLGIIFLIICSWLFIHFDIINYVFDGFVYLLIFLFIYIAIVLVNIFWKGIFYSIFKMDSIFLFKMEKLTNKKLSLGDFLSFVISGFIAVMSCSILFKNSNSSNDLSAGIVLLSIAIFIFLIQLKSIKKEIN